MTMVDAKTAQLINYLQDMMSAERIEKIDRNIKNRTRHITILLENIFQSQNASAVLRSAECLGIQDIHVVENNNLFEVNTEIAMGAAKWLTIHRYNSQPNNTITAIQKLRSDGYQIIATMPHENECMIEDLDISKPTVFMFGTELTGLSEEAIAQADGFVKIPMFGFTESFNISVSAALVMQTITTRLRKSDIQWQLTDIEQQELMLEWCRKSLKTPDLVVERFFSQSIQ
jgi:tRNA (guanosine-2'-O-)-methyltransferase